MLIYYNEDYYFHRASQFLKNFLIHELKFDAAKVDIHY